MRLMVRTGLGLLVWAVATALAGSSLQAQGLVSDLSPPDLQEPARVGLLSDASSKKARAMATFVRGLIEQEADGPDVAVESLLDSLELDPGNVGLAFSLSQEFLRRGDTVRALGILKDARKARPGHSDIPLALSLIYLRQLGKPLLALQYAEEAKAADPSGISPYEALWEIHRATGNAKAAARILVEAENSPSQDPVFWSTLSELLVRDELRTKASIREEGKMRILTSTAKALEFGPEDAVTQARAGDIYAILEEPGHAVAAYEKAHATNPQLPSLREKLVAAYRECGQPAQALDILEQIIADDPLSLQAYDIASELCLESGLYARAAGHMRQALIIAPDSLDRHLRFIETLFRAADIPGTLDAVNRAREDFPASPRLSYLEAIAESAHGDLIASLSAFARTEDLALQALPELLDASFYFDYGATAEQAGQPDRAEKLLRHSIALSPEHSPQALNYLGYMWVDSNRNLDEAEEFINQALGQDPDNGAFLDSLGWLRFRQGRYSEALPILLKALEQLPRPDPVVLDHIGDTYHKLNKPTEALSYWRRALAITPDDPSLVAKIKSLETSLASQKTD